MKLAEALRIRADLDRRIKDLKERIKNSAKIQEGDTPPENANELFKELFACEKKSQVLIYNINYTNIHTVWNEETLTYLIGLKDYYAKSVKSLKEILDHVNYNNDRYARNEIKMVRTINVQKLQTEYDKKAETLRKTDLLIQELNWKTELIEKISLDI